MVGVWGVLFYFHNLLIPVRDVYCDHIIAYARCGKIWKNPETPSNPLLTAVWLAHRGAIRYNAGDMANKTILDTEKIGRFLKAVELGASTKACCDAIGKSETWFYGVVAKAKADIEAGIASDEVEFYESFKKASAKFEEDNLEVIRQASRKGSWQASAWLLERRRPADYSAKVDVGGTGENLIIKTSVPRKGKQDGDA